MNSLVPAQLGSAFIFMYLKRHCFIIFENYGPSTAHQKTVCLSQIIRRSVLKTRKNKKQKKSLVGEAVYSLTSVKEKTWGNPWTQGVVDRWQPHFLSSLAVLRLRSTRGVMAATASATLVFFPPRLRPVGVASESFAAALTGAWFSFPPENQQITLAFHQRLFWLQQKYFLRYSKLKSWILSFLIFFHCEFSMNLTMSIY